MAGMPFCPGCGTQVAGETAGKTCARCSTPAAQTAQFCPACGYGLEPGAHRQRSSFQGDKAQQAIRIVVLDETGSTIGEHRLAGRQTTIGRQGADIEFPDDLFLSPRHALLNFVDGRLTVQDLGSRNRTWHFLEAPHRLRDGDLVLIGSQVIRFRRLGYPGPNPPEADQTRRMGSLVPSADIALLTQLRSDGSERDIIHLSPGRNITIGRDEGDWLFGFDPSLSGLHAQIRSEDADFVIVDAGSRNGVAIAVRDDVELGDGSRILVGDRMLRVEI